MKKVLLSVLAMSVVGASSTFATETSSGIILGINHAKIKDHTNNSTFTTNGTGLNLAWDSISVYDSGFAFGYGVGLNYVSVELGVNGNTPIYTFGTDIKLGYSPLKDLIGYGIVGINYQRIQYDNDPTNGTGFEFGGGVEYKVLSNMAVNLEYKTEKIKATGEVRDLTYDYSATSLNFKYIF